MQALASDETVTASGPHPTDEELAAYIDRRLGETDRARVTGHLASCDRCYSIFSGVVRFQLEEEELSKPVGGAVIPFGQEARGRRLQSTTAAPEVPSIAQRAGGRRRWWIPSTIAAALALVGIGLGVYSVFFSRPKVKVAGLVAPVEGKKGAADNLWAYSRFRSGGTPTPSDDADSHAAVQTGALLVDLRLASQAGQTKTAKELLRTIQRALQGTVFVPEEELARLAELERTLDKPRLKTLLAELPEMEAAWERDAIVEEHYFRLGKWVEAGRLAAELGEARFFQRRTHRRFLRSVLADEAMALPEEVRAHLEAIDQAWGTKDYAALAGHFQSILDHYDFRS